MTPSDTSSDKVCAFCGKPGAKNIYYQKLACDDCMAEKTKGQPPATEITSFPGQQVQEHLEEHGQLPGDTSNEGGIDENT